MRKASAKPAVITNTVGSPFRSNRALVATVVPILIAAISWVGMGSSSLIPINWRIPCMEASL